jgi:transcriptional regulator with XRE-family HTH domain
MLLGAQLRRLREAAGITRDDAGYHIRASGSKISRLELGRVSFKERDVTDLLELYGVVDQSEREKLVQLTREANATPWYQKFQDVVPDWFHVFVGLEEAAQLIRVYEVQFVPGLLQTQDYARAVISRVPPVWTRMKWSGGCSSGSAGSSCSAGLTRRGSGRSSTRPRSAARWAAATCTWRRSSG